MCAAIRQNQGSSGSPGAPLIAQTLSRILRVSRKWVCYNRELLICKCEIISDRDYIHYFSVARFVLGEFRFFSQVFRLSD